MVPKALFLSPLELALEGSQTLGNDLRKQARLLMPRPDPRSTESFVIFWVLTEVKTITGAGDALRILTDW